MKSETNIKNFVWRTAIMVTLLSSCSPVNMFTRLNKLPREHSDNFQIEGVKARKSEKHNTPWIVYSDRSDNAAFIKRGGQIQSEQIAFGDPFLVIKRKGEYLKLIKYKAENTKENRLSERKKAEYIGWVHQSNLLLSPASITDIRSGKKSKMLVAIRDTTTVFNARKYFKNGDSILVCQNPDLQKPTSAIALYDIVYALKYAKDGNSILVSCTPDVGAEEVREQLVGWIPTLLLQDIGRDLFVERPLSKRYPQPQSLRYSPVIRSVRTDSLVTFNSGHLIPLVDKRDNRIFNIDGSALSYLQSDSIKKELRNINVVFVFEPCETARTQFPVLLNIIQNLKTLFVSETGKYSYQFGAALATDNGIRRLSLNTDYSVFVDSVSSVASSILTGHPPAIEAWETLRYGLDLLEDSGNATNLVIVIGERGEGTENAPADIVSSLSRLNCRMMGVQLYATREAVYNNFVLQLSDMIEKYAAYQTVYKRGRIVFADQYCRSNIFMEHDANFYLLDYPAASMTQGGVMFPEKEEALALANFEARLDSLHTQIIKDNTLLAESLDLAFATAGSTKDRYADEFTEIFSIDNTKPNHDFQNTFAGKMPMWYEPTDRIGVTDSTAHYHLMLSENELQSVKDFLEKLCRNEVDVKDAGKPKKRKAKNICKYLEQTEYVTEEQLSARREEVMNTADTVYVSTKKIRKELIRLYLSKLNSCSICRKKNREYKRFTLAMAHLQIFGVPANNEILNTITIKELGDRNKVSDKELEQLVNYFKKTKNRFNDEFSKGKIESSGQPYYYVDYKLLP